MLKMNSFSFPTGLLRVAAIFAVVFALGGLHAFAQAVDGQVAPDADPPPLMYHGLIPGLHTHAKVREVLGEPADEAKWYSYKLYYPAEGREGLIDAIHVTGSNPEARLANIDAASIPTGYTTDAEIRSHLGEPEYTLRMATWTLLDYSEQGVRFALSSDGETIGVAYFPQGNRRVYNGARNLVDLSHLRQGPQPQPKNVASPDGLQVGVSEVVFSPTGSDWLGHAYTVHDDLKGRIAVFQRGELSIALVGADLFGMGFRDLNVMRRAASKMGVAETVVAMSHNHAAGDTVGVYGHYPAEYVEYIQQRIIAGIRQARDHLQPVKEFRVASKELPMDGIRVIGLFRNARNPGVLDPTISLLQPIGNDGKPIATFVHFACHVESLEKGPREISADFPGYMCEQLKRSGFGQPIFLNGALGGMVSGDNRARTHESAKAMGLRLAKIVEELSVDAKPSAEFHFSVDKRRVEIPLTNPRFKPLFESGLRDLNRGRVVTDMTYIRLGEAQLVTLPGELLPEVSFEILEKMDGFPRMLIGLANDQLGYMIPPYDFRDDEYEETMSIGPATALIVRDTALRLLSEH